MKKILIIVLVLFGSLAVKAQSNPFPSIDSLERFINRFIRNSPVEAFQNLRMNTALQGMLRFIETGEIGAGLDTAYAFNDSTIRLITFEPDTFDVTLRFFGTPNGNAGLGFRILKPSTQEIKTVFSDITGAWDSTSNAGGLTYKVDTTFMSSRAWRQKGIDSLNAALRAAMSDSVIYAVSNMLIPARIEFVHAGASSSTYQNDTLIGKQLVDVAIEGYKLSFISRATSVWMEFDSVTGTITLHNGQFVADDLTLIIYRTPPIFMLDGAGKPIRDGSGNIIILN
jgi:hypothetical protein